MAENRQDQRLTQFVRAGKRDLRRAILSGRRDGRRRMHCPGRTAVATAPPGDPQPPEYVVSTPYIDSIHQQVRATCGRMADALQQTQRTLRAETYRRADAFVRLHDAGRPTRGACGRFSAWLSGWNGLLHEHRKAVDKTVSDANYLIARYWEAVQVAHRHPWSWTRDRRPLCRALTP